jgi:hypothetical protein
VLALLALWGLYRLLVMLDRHGLMYYLRRPEGGGSSGGGSAWLPLQELANPNVRHVIEVQEQHRPAIDNEEGEPPEIMSNLEENAERGTGNSEGSG